MITFLSMIIRGIRGQSLEGHRRGSESPPYNKSRSTYQRASVSGGRMYSCGWIRPRAKGLARASNSGDAW